MCEKYLHLVKHVVINVFSLILDDLFGLSVINAEQVVPQRGNHEELLHHGVHVADASQVAQTHVLLKPFLSGLRLIAPSFGLLNCLNQWQELSVKESLHKSSAILY